MPMNIAKVIFSQTNNHVLQGCRHFLLLLLLPVVARAQFAYTTNSGAITITGYSGPGGDVAIPDAIDGLPVTSIDPSAFET